MTEKTYDPSKAQLVIGGKPIKGFDGKVHRTNLSGLTKPERLKLTAELRGIEERICKAIHARDWDGFETLKWERQELRRELRLW